MNRSDVSGNIVRGTEAFVTGTAWNCAHVRFLMLLLMFPFEANKLATAALKCER